MDEDSGEKFVAIVTPLLDGLIRLLIVLVVLFAAVAFIAVYIWKSLTEPDFPFDIKDFVIFATLGGHLALKYYFSGPKGSTGSKKKKSKG